MRVYQILGILGVALLVVGVFAPFMSIKIEKENLDLVEKSIGLKIEASLKSVSFFEDELGKIVLGIAIGSLIVLMVNFPRLLWLSGLASIGIMVFTYISIKNIKTANEISNTKAIFLKMADYDWGWIALCAGALLLVISAALPSGKKA